MKIDVEYYLKPDITVEALDDYEYSTDDSHRIIDYFDQNSTHTTEFDNFHQYNEI